MNVVLWNARSGERPLQVFERPTVLGRRGDVELPDPLLDRRHARVWLESGQVWFEDLGSARGSFLEGRRLEGPVCLAEGVPVVLGETVLAVAGAAPVPAPEPEVDGMRVVARQGVARVEGWLELLQDLLRAEEIRPGRLGEVVPAAQRVALVGWPPREDGSLVPLLPGPVSSTLARQAAERREACLLSEVAEVGPSVDLNRIRSAVYAPVLGRGGEVLGVLCVDTAEAGQRFDASDLQLVCVVAGLLGRELEARRLASGRDALADFLKIAGHDLADPLAVVVRSARMLQKGPPPDLAGELASLVLEAGLRARALIDSYLDVAALEGGRPLQVRWGTVDLATLVEEEIRLAGGGLESRVRCRAMRADGGKLRQVVANLLSNAVKFSPSREGIVVEDEVADGRVRIRVRDRGVGIALEDQDRLFREFVRLGGGSGAGLGLWLTAALVRAHGGTIGVESRLGEGSVFTVEIPQRP